MTERYLEEDSTKWRDWRGYDIKTVQGDIKEANFVPKKQIYEAYWALWGFKFHKRAWKRQKIYTRKGYLIVMISILPGVWMDLFLISVTDIGAAHILQVFICLVFISITLIYAECFLGDYTKRSACYIWNAMPITYCLLALQFITVIVESQQGCIRSLVYIQRLIHNLFFMDDWTECPEEQFDDKKCFDEDVDTLSPRCVSDDTWVVCPDNTNYILPSHYFYLNECNWRILYSPEHVVYVLLYWVIVALIASKGLARFIKTIQWLFTVIFFLYLIMLFYLITVCGYVAIKSSYIMSALYLPPLIDFEAWTFAFYVSLKLCSWGMMTYWTIASGLIFRTGRWMDSLLLMSMAMLGIIFAGAVRFGFVGCLAERMNTRIETIWKLRGINYTDAIIVYYLKNKPLGPLFTAIHNFSSFGLCIWSYAGLVNALIYGVAELTDMLEWQPTLLLVFVLLSVPLSLFIISFTQCGMIHDSPMRTSYISLQLLYMTGYAVTVFWLYGAQTLDEDHYFMYGYRPLGFIPSTWPWIPAIFLVGIMGDIYYNASASADKRIACIATYVVCIFITILGAIFVIYRHRKKKLPYSLLFKPKFTWGPPNGPLRRARKRFMPRTAITAHETARFAHVNLQNASELDRELHRKYVSRGPGLATDLETSRWKMIISSSAAVGMEMRGQRSAELRDEAEHAMVYAEDVNFFELVSDEEKQELPGTLPRTVSTVLVDEMDRQTRDRKAEFVKVETIYVKGINEGPAEGLTEELTEPPEIDKDSHPTKQRTSEDDDYTERHMSDLLLLKDFPVNRIS